MPWFDDEELSHGIDMWVPPEESVEDIVAMYRRSCETSATARSRA